MKNNILKFLFLITAAVSTVALIVHQRQLSFAPAEKEMWHQERVEETYAYQSMMWYNQQRAYPAGTVPHDWREKAYAAVMKNNLLQKPSSAAQLAWTAVGPNNIGGRIRSIAFDPTNSNTIYAGSVSGGIWKTTNGGTSWSSTNDFASNLVIGCLAIDPTNSNIIYAGTGEGYFNVDALQGIGVLKSTDGGTSWAVQTNFSTPSAQFGYYFINKLIIRPDNTNIVYAGMLGGIWRTTNGGTSWTKQFQGGSSSRCIDLVMHPTTYDIMYATFGNLSRDGIYKTTNGGTSWSKLTTGLPVAGYNRVNLGISKSNPLILYAVFDDSASHDTYNIYKTADGGTTWSVVMKPTNPLFPADSHLGGQGWYNNAVTVSPTDPNTVLIGGTNIFKSTNGGTSWTMKTNWFTQAPYQLVHADQHIMAYDPSNASTVYFGNDGGMFKSLDGGETFIAINSSLSTVQFYSGAVQPTGEVYYGGTQDNGTLKSVAIPVWGISFSGDGGATAVDQTTPANVYTEYVYLAIQKSTNSGATWTKSMSGIPVSGGSQTNGTSDRCLFIAPFAMDPTNSQILAAGTFKVYRTTNGAGSWTAISVDLTGDGDGTGQVGSLSSAISAIAIAKTSSATIYVGTSGSATAASAVQVTTNTGTTWTNTTKSPLPNRYVKAVAIDPANASRAFVAYSGYNGSTPITPGHVFLTTDRGVTWTNASGNLPDIPVNALLIDPLNTNDILAGTDIGIFQSVDAGATWQQQNNGLANVSVADLDYRSNDGAVFAATHGRGMFKLAQLTDVRGVSPDLPKETSLMQNYPNPFNPTTQLQFAISKLQMVTLKVYDIVGREVAVLVNETKAPGIYTASWNASAMPSGVYVYRLTAGSFSETRKMMLVK